VQQRGLISCTYGTIIIVVSEQVKIVIILLGLLLWSGGSLLSTFGSTSSGGTSPGVLDGIRELGAEAEPCENVWVSLSAWRVLFKGLKSLSIGSSWCLTE
jgi:hypothetical protein